nr:S-layer homology domain-containing protein [uncultured Agathobaculum sp.]
MLALVLALSPAAFAGDDAEGGDGGSGGSVSKATVTFIGDSWTWNKDAETDIAADGSQSYELTMAEGRKLDSIHISVADEDKDTEDSSVTLDVSKLSGEIASVLTAKVEAWPERTRTVELTIAVDPALEADCAVTVSCSTSSPKFSARIEEKSGSAITNGSDDEVAYGSEVTLGVVPDDGYRLSSLTITYGEEEPKQITASTDWNGLKVTWNAEGNTTVSGELYADLSVEAVVEEIPVKYNVTIDVDSGMELVRPSSRVTSLLQGETLEVRVKAKTGYLISDCSIKYGKSYATWASGQSAMQMGNDRVQVQQKSGEVWFYLPEVYVDTDITFTSDYDPDNIPIEIDEGSRINIDSSCGETVARGDDAEFYIYTTSDSYSVKKVTLTIGDSTGSADPSDGEIRVGRKTYEIEDVGDGEYTLYVDNITEPVTVAATSSSSGTVSRPTLTIKSSSHVTITKSVSSNRVDAGDDVNFYFSPSTNYQVDQITLKVGSNTRTVSADKTYIRVGGETYQMSRGASGTVTLFVTDIDENVTVSATSYYSTSPVEPSNMIKINTSSRSAFMNGYADGTFRPQSYMTRAEAVVMLYRLCSVNVDNSVVDSSFRDVPSTLWCAREVNAFAYAGIIDQTSYFYPDSYITRAELTEMLYRLSGSPSVSGSAISFNDIGNVPNSNAIRYAAYRSWVNGYDDGSFRPYANIERSEVATLMTRVLGRTSGGTTTYYTDVPYTHWAYRYIQLASSYV